MQTDILARQTFTQYESPAPRTNPRPRSPWIIGPIFDMLFVAGGLPIVLIGLNLLSAGWLPPPPFSEEDKPVSDALLALVLVGQHLFANAHNIATYLRIWGSEEDRERFRFYRTWLVAMLFPLFLWGLYSSAATGIFVYIFLMAVFWHYAAQSYGVALIYCYKRNYILAPFEKRIMKLTMTSLSAFAILRMLSFRNFSPYEWYGVQMPFWGPFPAFFFYAAAIVFGGSVAAFALVVARKYYRDKQLLPLPSLLVLLAVAALGLSESAANALLWFYIPPFFHGTQYLAISLSYALKERGDVGTISLRKLLCSPLAIRMWITTVVVGAILYVLIPRIFGSYGFDIAMVSGLVLAIVNFHHFFTDAAIWKLRDPRCREILLA